MPILSSPLDEVTSQASLSGPRYYYPRCLVVFQALLADATLTKVGWIAIPRRVAIDRNTFRMADTCKVDLDFRDFPLDPRAIADLTIAVHIDSVEHARAQMIPTRANLRFVGRVDQPEMTLGPEEEVVEFEARDYTGIYLDTRYDWVKNPIDLPGLTLRAAVEQVRNVAEPDRASSSFDDLQATIFYDEAAANSVIESRTGRSVFTGEPDDNCWDVLTRLCDLYGMFPSFDLDILQIRGATEAGLELAHAKMMYGKNVEKISFRKNFKKKKDIQVLVRAYDPVAGTITDGEYPPLAEWVRLNTKGEKGPTTVKQTNHYVEGPYDQPSLVAIAKRIWEEGRIGETDGVLETREMLDLEGNPEIVGLRNGDRLNIDIGSPDFRASLSAMSDAEQIAHLSDPTRTNHLLPHVAAALVKSWSTAKMITSDFYVLAVHHEWDREDGYSNRIHFGTFILGV